MRCAAIDVRVGRLPPRSGSRVAVELIVSESECQETVNSILMKDFHPVSTLTPSLPSVSLYMHARVRVPGMLHVISRRTVRIGVFIFIFVFLCTTVYIMRWMHNNT